MSKRVLTTLKMSIRYYTMHYCHSRIIVVLSATSECKVISLHKYAGAMPWMDLCRAYRLYIKIDMK